MSEANLSASAEIVKALKTGLILLTYEGSASERSTLVLPCRQRSISKKF